MDFYYLAIGILLLIGGVLILIVQINNKAYSKENLNNGVIHLTGAGVIAMLSGLYFIVTSF